MQEDEERDLSMLGKLGHMRCRLVLVCALAGWAACLDAAVAASPPPVSLPSLDEVVVAKRDLWGEAAMSQPDGASYEFFEKLLPPLRYVHADFREYPLVLSAPRAAVKARLISDGSGVNLPGGSRSWHDTGTPVLFRVGPDEYRFGSQSARSQGPKLAEGWLPIVEWQYLHPHPQQATETLSLNAVPPPKPAETYRLEAFASTDSALAECGLVFTEFRLSQGETGLVTADVDAPGLVWRQGRLADNSGQILLYGSANWNWERGALHARLAPGQSAQLAIATRPHSAALLATVDANVYAQQRAAAVGAWKALVNSGMVLDCPEPRVNHAWRNLLVQNYGMLRGDRIHYSAGNQYDQLYEAEGSDAALAMLAWGGIDEMRRMIVPLLDFTRKGLEYHQAGLKLNDVAVLYWHTRDKGMIEALRPRWEKELKRILAGRTGPYQLFPKERYCGDVGTQVHSLSASAKAWRAVRDMAAVLGAVGDPEADALLSTAADYRRALLAAVEASVSHETDPPFVPVALLADEAVHDPITATRIGSYWNLVINFVQASGLFPPGSEQETWIPRYLETHGGLAMGMTRAGSGPYTFWNSAYRINPLYGTRYVVDALRRDDPERALVSLYGMLAQGLTRDTLIGGEGAMLVPVDPGGRFFYCPPNSAGNGHVLTILRNLLVQDFDLDDDGQPETLRLLYATPRRWLEDGKQLRLERAPTAFGPVALAVESHLGRGFVRATVELPTKYRPQKTLIRVRLPEGWQATEARVADRRFKVDSTGSADISALSGRATIVFAVERER